MKKQFAVCAIALALAACSAGKETAKTEMINPLGQTVGLLRGTWHIVGVCRDTKYGNLKEPAPPTAYLSFRQLPLHYRTSFAVRTALSPSALAAAVREAVAAINPAIPVARLVTQEQLRDGNISQERLFATLCGALAGLALLLSCLGLYGLMAYNVARRTGEIAIRMAIGAPAGQIARSFMREALVLTALGVGVGLPAVLDRDTGGSTSMAAVAGYPSITVPAGFVHGLPVGLSFFAGAYSEPKLLRLAFAFERASKIRRPPHFLAGIERGEIS